MTTEITLRRPELPTAADMNAAALYAERLAHSGLLPTAYRKQPANVLYAIEYGRMIGLAPMAAITGVHVIEGKPTASAALISALVRRAGHKLRVRGDAKEATAQIIRADDPDYTFEVTYTIGDAQRAGLLNKQVWKSYPASMLKARAITQCARDACEEALMGMHYTPEELGAEVDEDGEPVAAVPDAPAQPAAVETVVDAEIVSEPEPATGAQLGALAVLIGRKVGKLTDEQRHAALSQAVGRTITSARQLTKAEASQVMDDLSRRPDLPAAEPPAAPVSEQEQADAVEARLRAETAAAGTVGELGEIVRRAEGELAAGRIGQVHLSEVQEAANLRRLELEAEPVGASA